jgi:hypothetical protein
LASAGGERQEGGGENRSQYQCFHALELTCDHCRRQAQFRGGAIQLDREDSDFACASTSPASVRTLPRRETDHCHIGFGRRAGA